MKVNNEEKIIFDKDSAEIFTISPEFKNLEIVISANVNVSLKLDGINNLEELFIICNAGSTAKINFICNDLNCSLQLHGIVHDNASLTVNGVDFCYGNTLIKSNIILLGVESSSTWNMSSLSLSKYEKRYAISFSHIGEGSKSKMNNYGVAIGESKLYFEGCTHIEKEATKSNANQIAKIIVYDKQCQAKANPVLKIDNQDIVASHGAAVGTLNSEHIFYLLSRGITMKEARNLITFGYLKPVFANFDEKDAEYLSNLLEERI